MAKRLLLVSGESGADKSCFAKALKTCYGFKAMSVDAVYVDFIKEKCPELYFKKLNQFSAPHYDHILKKTERALKHPKWNYVEEWEAHLEAQVRERMETHDDVVVEGYLLKYSKERLQTHLQGMGMAQVFCTEVKNCKYYIGDCNLTLEQVAALGSDAAPA